MAVQDLDDSNFTDALAGSGMAVVDFYAGWCGPCRLFKPKFNRLSNELTHIDFFKLDGEKAPNARKSVEIPGLPFFALYKHGEFIAGQSTSKPEALRAMLVEHFGEAGE